MKYPMVLNSYSFCIVLWMIADGGCLHICDRDCTRDRRILVCDYDLRIKLGRTLDEKSCGKCPSVVEDCYKDNCIVGDGIERPIYTINDMFPGPGITVCEDDTVRINVTNALVGGEAITMHWHGIHQNGSPYMDGVPMITQCPIITGSTFTYKWRANPAGTKFYHSHTSSHRVDGIVGPMVIRSRTNIIDGTVKPLPDPSHLPNSSCSDKCPEFSVIVQEWKDSLSPFHFIKDDEAAPSLVINGRQGSWPNSPPSYFLVGRTCNTEAEADGSDNSSGIDNRCYPLSLPKPRADEHDVPLFRFVSNGFLYCPIVITVEDHVMVVAAMDGFPVELGTRVNFVQALTIFSGERYDVWLVRPQTYPHSLPHRGFDGKLVYRMEVVSFGECDHGTKVANASAYLIYAPNTTFGHDRAIELIKNQFFTNNSNINNHSLGIINRKQVLNPVHLKDLKTSRRNVPITNFKMDKELTSTLVTKKPNHILFLFTDSFKLGEDIPMFNNISFLPPSSPILTQPYDVRPEELCNLESRPECSHIFCKCLHSYKIKFGSLVELIIVDEGRNGEYDIHSIHLHGHHFAVLAQEKLGDTLSIEEVKRLDAKGKLVRNLDAPILKDTVAVPEGGYVIIRFRATNPGYWMLHCHLDFHLMKGMALILKVGQNSDIPKIPFNFPRCGNWYGDKEAKYKIDSSHPYQI